MKSEKAWKKVKSIYTDYGRYKCALIPITQNSDVFLKLEYGQIECLLRSIKFMCGKRIAKSHIEDMIEILYSELEDVKKL